MDVLRRYRTSLFLTPFLVVAAVACGAAATQVGGSISPGEPLLFPLGIILIASFRAAYARQRRIAASTAGGGYALRRAAVACLAVALLFITWNGVRTAANLSAGDVFLLLAGIFAILGRATTPSSRRSLAPIWITIPALVILVVAVYDTVTLGQSLSDLSPGLRLVIALGLTPVVIGFIAGNMQSLWLLVDCWLASAAVNSLVADADYLVHSNIGTTITGFVYGGGRFAGLTTHPNHLAFVTVLALPVILSRLLTVSQNVLRTYYVGLLAADFVALLSSGARGGLVAGALVLFLTPFLQQSRRDRTVAFAGTTAAGAAMVGVLVFTSAGTVALQRLTDSQGAQIGVAYSDQVRASYAHDALAQFSIHPLTGGGFANLTHAHDVYLELLSAGGMVVLLAFAALLLGAIAAGVRLSRTRTLEPELASLAGALTVSIIGCAAMGLVENAIADRYLYVPYSLLVAVGVMAAKSRQVPVSGLWSRSSTRASQSWGASPPRSRLPVGTDS